MGRQSNTSSDKGAEKKIVSIMNEGEAVPYYKDYINNAIRGAITAACFATFFLIIAIINHFKWRRWRRRRRWRRWRKWEQTIWGLKIEIMSRILTSTFISPNDNAQSYK